MLLKTKTKRNIFIMFALAAAIASVPVSAKDVTTFADLCNIANDLKENYVLTDNITVTKKEITDKFGADGFKPIGTEKNPFTGTFRGKDGKTFVIRGLYINRPKEGDVGLFGYAGRGAEISRVGVVTDTGGVTGLYSVGVLAGTNKGVIENCYGAGVVRASVSGARIESSAGGLVGFNGGRIEKSYSAADVFGRHYVGGLAGFLTVDPAGQIFESYATGEATGASYVGGLVGYIFDGSVEKCFSTGKVVGDGDRGIVGGLVGGDFGSSNTSWNVRGKNGAGSYIKDAEIKNSFWDKNTSGVDHSTGGEGKTSDEMRKTETFRDWDFDSTWNIADGAGYPSLQAAPVCTLSYKAGFNGTLRVGGAYVPADSVFMVILEEGAKAPEVTAIPDANYMFDNWTDKADSPARSDAASRSAKVDVTALFSLKPNAAARKLTYMVENGQEAWGTLRVNVKGVIVESSKYSVTVIMGAVGFEVTAVPAAGCVFKGWDDGRTDSVRADVSEKDVTFSAIFEKTVKDPDKPDAYYSFLYTSGEGGGLWKGRGAGALAYVIEPPLKEGGAGPLMAAVPDAGYRFVRWNDGGKTLVRSDLAKPNATFMAVFGSAAGNPIEIVDYNDLLKIGSDAKYPLDGNYILTKDIDAPAGGAFTPIGGREKPFVGVFDGNRKTISGLTVDEAGGGGGYAGLFGYAENARISRVYLAGASVSGGNNTGALAGGIVNTYMDSCAVDGGSVTGADSVGGLVGSASGSLISRSYSTAEVSGKNGAGGLAGVAAGSMVTHSYSTGMVGKSGAASVGGLVGRAEAGIAQYSYAVGNAQGASAAGGFVGAVSQAAEFYHCYSAGYVDGAGGGFAGAEGTGGGAAYKCYWDADISEQSASAGGLGTGIGSIEMTNITTYTGGGWDFENVWKINKGDSYPYLRELEPQEYPGFGMLYKSRQVSLRQTEKRLLNVRNRIMTVNAPHGVVWQVRVIDMRGRTVARYNTLNSNKISLYKIPSGKYMIEARDRGKRVDVQGVVLK